MTLSLDQSSAKLTIELNNSQPTIHVGTKSIIVALKESLIDKNAANAENPTKATTGDAVTVTGTVFLTAGENDFDIGDWEFGMVQVAQLHGYRFLYAGKTDAHGSIAINRMAAYTKNPCLDVEPVGGQTIDQHIFDFSHTEANLVRTPTRGFNVTVRFGDHPSNFMPLTREHESGATNFIASAYRNEAFITYFVARENANAPIVFLGRVGWHFVVAAEFKWKTGTAKPTRKITEQLIYPGTVLMGAPPDTDGHFTIAKNRTTPTTNKQDENAATAIAARRDPVWKSSASRPSDLPADFFT